MGVRAKQSNGASDSSRISGKNGEKNNFLLQLSQDLGAHHLQQQQQQHHLQQQPIIFYQPPPQLAYANHGQHSSSSSSNGSTGGAALQLSGAASNSSLGHAGHGHKQHHHSHSHGHGHGHANGSSSSSASLVHAMGSSTLPHFSQSAGLIAPPTGNAGGPGTAYISATYLPFNHPGQLINAQPVAFAPNAAVATPAAAGFYATAQQHQKQQQQQMASAQQQHGIGVSPAPSPALAQPIAYYHTPPPLNNSSNNNNSNANKSKSTPGGGTGNGGHRGSMRGAGQRSTPPQQQPSYFPAYAVPTATAPQRPASRNSPLNGTPAYHMPPAYCPSIPIVPPQSLTTAPLIAAASMTAAPPTAPTGLHTYASHLQSTSATAVGATVPGGVAGAYSSTSLTALQQLAGGCEKLKERRRPTHAIPIIHPDTKENVLDPNSSVFINKDSNCTLTSSTGSECSLPRYQLAADPDASSLTALILAGNMVDHQMQTEKASQAVDDSQAVDASAAAFATPLTDEDKVSVIVKDILANSGNPDEHLSFWQCNDVDNSSENTAELPCVVDKEANNDELPPTSCSNTDGPVLFTESPTSKKQRPKSANKQSTATPISIANAVAEAATSCSSKTRCILAGIKQATISAPQQQQKPLLPTPTTTTAISARLATDAGPASPLKVPKPKITVQQSQVAQRQQQQQSQPQQQQLSQPQQVKYELGSSSSSAASTPTHQQNLPQIQSTKQQTGRVKPTAASPGSGSGTGPGTGSGTSTPQQVAVASAVMPAAAVPPSRKNQRKTQKRKEQEKKKQKAAGNTATTTTATTAAAVSNVTNNNNNNSSNSSATTSSKSNSNNNNNNSASGAETIITYVTTTKTTAAVASATLADKAAPTTTDMLSATSNNSSLSFSLRDKQPKELQKPLASSNEPDAIDATAASDQLRYGQQRDKDSCDIDMVAQAVDVDKHVANKDIVAKFLQKDVTNANAPSQAAEPQLEFLNSSSSICEDEDLMSIADVAEKSTKSKTDAAELNVHQIQINKLPNEANLSELKFGDFIEEATPDNSSFICSSTWSSSQPASDLVKISQTTLSEDNVDCCAPGDSTHKIELANKKVSGSAGHQSVKSAVSNTNVMGGSKAITGTLTRSRSASKFIRYNLEELRELSKLSISRKPPLVPCQKGDCISQLFVSRQSQQVQQQQQQHHHGHNQYGQQFQHTHESMDYGSGKRGRGHGHNQNKKHHDGHQASMSGGITSANNSGPGGGGMGSSNRRHMDIIRVQLSLKEEIKLSECKNAWQPEAMRRMSSFSTTEIDPDDDMEVVLKKVRGILNKLTPDNFEVLLKEMSSIKMDTQAKMTNVMLLIFEKTISEPNFAPTYARFCKVLFHEIKAENKSLFTSSLITRIQHEFESNVNDANAKAKKLQPTQERINACTDPAKKAELRAEMEDLEYQFRRRAWGTVRFIGELFKLQSLTSDRVLHCVESLLEHGCEEKLEYMCKLLTTVGHLLEAGQPEQYQSGVRIEKIFRRIQDIVQRSRFNASHTSHRQHQHNIKISSRVRFMMQDVLDLRSRNWDQPVTAQSAAANRQQRHKQLDEPKAQQQSQQQQQHSSGSGGVRSGQLPQQQAQQQQQQSSISQYQQQKQHHLGHESSGNYFMQKSNKSQHQENQSLSIDVNKLRFSSGGAEDTTTAKLGNSSLYQWPSNRPTLLTKLVEEVLSTRDWQNEVLTIWRNSNTNRPQTVESIIYYVLMEYVHRAEVKRQQRLACANVFSFLMRHQAFGRVIFAQAYGRFGEDFPDLLVDVPNGWTYVFEFLGPILHEGCLDFNDVWQSRWLEDAQFTERFVRAFVNYFVQEFGASFTHKLWHIDNKLDRGQLFWSDARKYRDFLQSNSFQFLEPNSTPTTSGVQRPKVTRTPAEHVERISYLLRLSSDTAIDYINTNVHINVPFVRQLTKFLCCDFALTVITNKPSTKTKNNHKTNKNNNNKKQLQLNVENFKSQCTPLLRLCIDMLEAHEIACIEESLDSIHRQYTLECDSGELAMAETICSIWSVLYDSEVISRDSFQKWLKQEIGPSGPVYPRLLKDKLRAFIEKI
ncbi:uncharacterized protein LOC6567423 [Drosophila grimshawi]|uniref:uncharacterized protein LOC6567423 n=1 Tax=Drosophila grimshawi TaxID=7222 RepID=UPI001C936EA3|nr:uncharacterized protein LOC6567423 [Drosophila grimshawi]